MINLSTVLFFLCCSLSISLTTKTYQCKQLMSAFPPHPDSGCCGVDRFSSIGAFEEGIKKNLRITHILDYPWLAIIEYKQKGTFETPCGGALISGKYVLTTSHCLVEVQQEIGKPENVILGEYDRENQDSDCYISENLVEFCNFGTVKIPIEKFICHPLYVSRQHPHDIALIRMKEIAPYTPFIRPVCLPTTDIPYLTGTVTFNKASWGSFSPDEPTNIKSQVTLHSITQDKCKEAYQVLPIPTINLTKYQICTGFGGKKSTDFCHGDAGFPLTYINNFNKGLKYRSEVAGIVSFGACNDAFPTVYTKVFEYKSWILQIVDE